MREVGREKEGKGREEGGREGGRTKLGQDMTSTTVDDQLFGSSLRVIQLLECRLRNRVGEVNQRPEKRFEVYGLTLAFRVRW